MSTPQHHGTVFHILGLELPLTPLVRIFLLNLVAVAAYGFYKWLLPKPIPGIPHNPKATSRLLGDIPDMAVEMSKSGDLNLWLRRQARNLKSPLIQVFIRPLGKPFLILSDYQEAQDVLLHRAREFDRTEFVDELFSGVIPYHHFPMKTGLGWKAHRKLLQDLMTPDFLRNVAAPAIYDCSLDLVNLWAEKAKLAGGRPFSVLQDFHNTALDAVLSFAFGKDFPHRATRPQLELLRKLGRDGLNRLNDAGVDTAFKFPQAEINEGIKAVMDLSDYVGELKKSPVPRLKWWCASKMPSFARAQRVKREFLCSQLEKSVKNLERHGSTGDNSWVHSAIDHMVDRERRFAEKEQREPQYISPVMRDEVDGFVIAGHDTTSTTLSWGVKMLADNPRVQSRLRSVLRDAFPEAVKEGRLPSYSEIVNTTIPYLDATLEEILRCSTTAYMVDRQAVQDTVLLGHHIPKGTVVFMLSTGASFFEPAFDIDHKIRSPTSRDMAAKGRVRSWSDENRADFMPERWLVGAEEMGQNLNSVVEHKESASSCDRTLVFDASAGPTMPFGAGLRGCFGRRLGYLEMRLILTVIIWKFELLQCPKELSGYEAFEGVAHKPRKCFVKLFKVAN